MDDTKITIRQSDLHGEVKKELEQSVKNLPDQYKRMLEEMTF